MRLDNVASILTKFWNNPSRLHKAPRRRRLARLRSAGLTYRADDSLRMERLEDRQMLTAVGLGQPGETFDVLGRKFEDLNADGSDNGGTDPGLGGITIEVYQDADGDTIFEPGGDDNGPVASMVTAPDGTYNFVLNIIDGLYFVTEQAVPGLHPTTPTVIEIPPVEPGSGITGIDFGNAFEGSIHGYKFNDLNGDGVQQQNIEGPLAGVTIVLTASDGSTQTTTTDAGGEYWFTWLRPGLTYNVTEVPPAGFRQSTPNPAPITILSGQEYVAHDLQGVAIQRQVTFPWWWTVEIDPVPIVDQGLDPTPPQQVMLQGLATVAFSTDQNGQTFIDPANGLPLPIPADGQVHTFQTEIVSMDLTSVTPVPLPGGNFMVSLQGTGEGELNVQNNGTTLLGDSFFDVNFAITITDPTTGQSMRIAPDPQDGPVNVGMTFTPGQNPDEVPEPIPARDWRWLPTFFWRVGLGRDLLDNAGNLWDELISIHAVPHVELEKPVRPVLWDGLAFGNTPFRSSIHGYKFEDLNVNGVDDNLSEPRLGGVTITLTGDSDGDGATDTQTAVTDGNGEYWFTDIHPGTYTVAETVGFGLFPTTPTSFSVTVGPNEELVALPGQAMIPANDPRVEVVVGPRLAFGNAFEGSIHGYKFSDLDGDGIQDNGEPRRGGVEIVLMADGVEIDRAVTDDNGEYWFTWLEPGRTYTVREVLPPGHRQTTQNPAPITILSGQEYVANDFQGIVVQQQVTFPWWWMIEVVPADMPTAQPEQVMVQGLATFRFGDFVDPSNPNNTAASVDRATGLPNPVPPGGPRQIQTELVSMDLTGFSQVLGGDIRITGQGTGVGGVQNDDGDLIGGYGGNFHVDSFFDIVYRIEVTPPGAGQPTMVLAPQEPVSVGMDFGPDGFDPDDPAPIPPRDYRWLPTFFWTQDQQVIVDTLGVPWDTVLSIHATPHVEIEKPVRPIVWPGLAFGNTPGRSSIHGYKYEDLNANGRDDNFSEPRIAGVVITLMGDVDGDGDVDTQMVTTDANGEYWFEDLVPGTYMVSETPPPGSFPTTPTKFTVTVGANEELVALPGQAHLPPNDSRVEVVVGPRLAFGNAYEGSIHGYKFDDLNVNGVDDNLSEPRIGGVTVTLSGDVDGDGVTDTRTEITDGNGEYWFENLRPGTYVVTETPPQGSIPTTPTSFTVLVGSRQELVALPGQANLPANDPRFEVVIGPRLAFGNAFEGSIHGFKFQDFNGDGVRQNNEPPIADVQIILFWTDQNGLPRSQTTTTDANGEYWFSWLRPGLSYFVREIVPPGGRQTTPNPPLLFIGSGTEWVATEAQAAQVQRAVSFPWWVTVQMDPVPVNPAGPDPTQPVSVMFAGMAMFNFSDLVDAATGEVVPLVNPNTGLPNPVPQGRQFQIQTDASFTLSAENPFGPGEIVLTGSGAGRGRVRNDQGVLVGGFDPQFTVDSFFDIDFRIDFQTDDGQSMTLAPPTPIEVGMNFTPEDQIRPTDIRWMPTIIWRTGLGRDLLDDAGNLWDQIITIHAEPHVEVEKPVRPRIESRLSFGNFRQLGNLVLTTDAMMINEGESIELTGSFENVPPQDHKVTIMWGDGTTSMIELDPGEMTFSMEHTYRDDNPSGTPQDPYTIKVTVMDATGAMTMNTTQIIVKNLPPIFTSLEINPTTVPSGGLVTVTGTYTDAGVDDTHTTDWDVGDDGTFEFIGQVVSGGSFSFNVPVNLPPGDHLISVRLNDDDVGSATIKTQVTVTPRANTLVTSCQLVHNNSVFDGNNPAGNAADLNAVDPSKSPLPLGQTSAIDNVSGNSKGITGILIGLSPAPDFNIIIAPSDLNFIHGRTNNLADWAAAPLPAITPFPGAGPNGESLWLFTWPNNAIQDTFLAVQILANANTGLAETHTCIYGNVRGETGARFPNGPLFGRGGADLQAMAQPGVLFQPAGLGSSTDINRDGRTDAFDFQALAIAGINPNVLPAITPVLNSPAGLAAAAFDAAITTDQPAHEAASFVPDGNTPVGSSPDGRVGTTGVAESGDRDRAFASLDDASLDGDDAPTQNDLFAALATDRLLV